MKKNNKYIAPVMLLLVSMLLFIVVFYVDMGCGCGGWNLINPLCWIEGLVCNLTAGIMKTVAFIGAIVLFIAGISLLIKRAKK